MQMILSTKTGGISKKLGDREAIRILSNAGYDAYDFSFTAHPANSSIYEDNTFKYFHELRAFADDCGIVCNQAHAPVPSSVGKSEEDEKIYQRVIRSMEAASILGAKIIVVHPKQHLIYAEHQEELYEINVKFYKSLISYCKQFGIKVAVENMWQTNKSNRSIIDSTCSRAWEFCKYLDAIDSEWIVGCLDIGHVSLMGADIPAFIRQMGNRRLQCLHVHDTDFVHDLHTIPFVASIDYVSVMKALRDINYQGDFTFEADGFLEKFPEELFPEVATFMCQIGRFLTNNMLEDECEREE